MLIVTMQPFAAQASGFRTAAKRWNLLEGTGFTALAIVSPAELEYYASIGDADEYARGIEELWDGLDPSSFDRPSEGVTFDETNVSEVVTDGWNRLFPEAPSPWTNEGE